MSSSQGPRLDGTPPQGHDPNITLNDGRENTLVGLNAGLRLAGSKAVQGRRNTFVGANVGAQATMVANCVFVGARTGEAARAVESATFLGVRAGAKTRDSIGDTLVGYEAGAVIRSSTFNTLLGYRAGSEFLSGTRVTAVGALAAYYNQSCRDSTYVGHLAGANQRRNDFVTAIGAQAGNAAVGSSTTLVGWGAGAGLRGNSATSVGASAGLLAVGDGGVFVGAGAGTSSLGDANTAVGSRAMGYDTAFAGSRNTVVGYEAGHKLVGDDNTLLGSRSCPSLRGNANALLGGNMLLAPPEHEISAPPLPGAALGDAGVSAVARRTRADPEVVVTSHGSAAVGQDVDVRNWWHDDHGGLSVSNVALLGCQLYVNPDVDAESCIVSTNVRVLKANRALTLQRTGVTVCPAQLDAEIICPLGRDDVWYDPAKKAWRPCASTGPPDVGLAGGDFSNSLVEASGYGPEASLERYGVTASALDKTLRVYAGEGFTAAPASVRLSLRAPTFSQGTGNVHTARYPDRYLDAHDVLVADRVGATISGTARADFLAGRNLLGDRALVSASVGNVVVASATTATEIEFVHGARSNIQSQIDAIVAKIPNDPAAEAKPPGPALPGPLPPSPDPHPIPIGGVGGWVLVQVASLPGAPTEKSGSVLFSYMPSAGGPFAALVKKSDALSTLSLSRYELGVMLHTDADCEVAWSYLGHQGSTGGGDTRTTLVPLADPVGVQHIIVSDASGSKTGSALVSHFPDDAESTLVSVETLGRHSSPATAHFGVAGLSPTSLSVIADSGVFVTHAAPAQGKGSWAPAADDGAGGHVVPSPSLPGLVLVKVTAAGAVPVRYGVIVVAFGGASPEIFLKHTNIAGGIDATPTPAGLALRCAEPVLVARVSLGL